MTTNTILDRITYHAVYDDSVFDALDFAAENGFAGVQLAEETPHLSLAALSSHDRDHLARLIERRSQRLTVHAPDDTASLFVTDRTLASGVLAYFRALFDICAEAGVSMVTMHVGQPVTFRTATDPVTMVPEQDLPLYREALERNLREVIAINEGRFTLCVENNRWTPLLEEVVHPLMEDGDLFLCWDLAKTGDTDGPFYDKHARFVRQVHLHDRRRTESGASISHCVIGTGDIDFDTPLQALRNVPVEEYCIEVRPREKAVESLEVVKKMVG